MDQVSLVLDDAMRRYFRDVAATSEEKVTDRAVATAAVRAAMANIPADQLLKSYAGKVSPAAKPCWHYAGGTPCLIPLPGRAAILIRLYRPQHGIPTPLGAIDRIVADAIAARSAEQRPQRNRTHLMHPKENSVRRRAPSTRAIRAACGTAGSQLAGGQRCPIAAPPYAEGTGFTDARRDSRPRAECGFWDPEMCSGRMLRNRVPVAVVTWGGPDATPDKASWPPKWDEHSQVHVPFRYLGENGTTIWSGHDSVSTWIRCEGGGAPRAVSPARPPIGAGVVGVGGNAATDQCAVGGVAHVRLTAYAAVVVDLRGGASSA